MTARDRVTMAAVVVVALVAAIVSYAHMQLLASNAGESWRSWLIPISVDGLIVAASMVLLTSRRQLFAWGSLVTGVIASLAANMAAARPEAVAVLVAGWAPVAFAASFHLLLQQRRLTSTTTAVPELVTATATPGLPAAPGSTGMPAFPAVASTTTTAQPSRSEPVAEAAAPPVVPAEPSTTAAPKPPTAPRGKPGGLELVRSSAPPRAKRAPHKVEESGSGPSTKDDPLIADARPLVNAGLGRPTIAKRLNVGSNRARLLINAVHAENAQRPAVQS